MPTPSDVATGNIVLLGLPDLQCYTSMQEFVQALPSILGVEIPLSVSNVIVSNIQPNSNQTTYLWARLNNAGGFIGLYIFSAGAWRPIFPVTDGLTGTFGLYRFIGDSRAVPAGYRLADASNPAVPGVAVAPIQATWIFDDSNTYYVVYDATFQGF